MKPMLAIAIHHALQKKQRRELWVHPLNLKRLSFGKFHVMYGLLREFPDKFREYYRMSISTHDELLELISESLRKEDTRFRLSISPEERLMVTIRYMSTGMTFLVVSQDFLMGRSTVRRIVYETCQVIWNQLQPLEMPQPTEQMWLDIAHQYYLKTNFPNCLGAIDGKHIRIMCPKSSGSLYFNYKKYFSLILLGLADANCCFISIDVGACGKEGDSSIFTESNLGKKFYRNMLDFPKPRKLPNSMEPPQRFVFIGDEAFQAHPNLFFSQNISPMKVVYHGKINAFK